MCHCKGSAAKRGTRWHNGKLWLLIIVAHAGLAFKLHFAQAEGETEGDVARAVAGGGAAGDVRIGVGRGTRVSVEDILHIEVERQMPVEQVGTDAEVGGEEGVVAAEEGDLTSGIVDVAEHLQNIP